MLLYDQLHPLGRDKDMGRLDHFIGAKLASQVAEDVPVPWIPRRVDCLPDVVELQHRVSTQTLDLGRFRDIVLYPAA